MLPRMFETRSVGEPSRESALDRFDLTGKTKREKNLWSYLTWSFLLAQATAFSGMFSGQAEASEPLSNNTHETTSFGSAFDFSPRTSSAGVTASAEASSTGQTTGGAPVVVVAGGVAAVVDTSFDAGAGAETLSYAAQQDLNVQNLVVEANGSAPDGSSSVAGVPGGGLPGGDHLPNIVQPVLPILEDILNPILGPVAPILNPVLGVVDDVIDAVGPVLDSVIDLVEAVTDPLVPVIEDVIGIVTPVLDPVIDVVEAVVAPVLPVVEAVVDVVTPVLEPVVALVEGVVAPVVDVAEAVVDVVAPVVDPVLEIVAEVAAPVVGVVETAVDTLAPVLDPVVDLVGSAASPVTEVVETVLNAVTPALDPVLDVVTGITEPVADVIGDVTGLAAPVLDPVTDLVGDLAAPVPHVVADLVGVLSPALEVVSAVTNDAAGAALGETLGLSLGDLFASGDDIDEALATPVAEVLDGGSGVAESALGTGLDLSSVLETIANGVSTVENAFSALVENGDILPGITLPELGGGGSAPEGPGGAYTSLNIALQSDLGGEGGSELDAGLGASLSGTLFGSDLNLPVGQTDTDDEVHLSLTIGSGGGGHLSLFGNHGLL